MRHVTRLAAVAFILAAAALAGAASRAHSFEGWTGLAVTVGAVVTLFVVMQLTARVDRERVLAAPPAAAPPAPARGAQEA